LKTYALGLGAILLSLLSLLHCPPQVYRIAGSPASASAHHILFLSAGFSDGELDAYRVAAAGLANTIMTSEPYAAYAANLSFWRIDVRSGPIGTSTCPAGACGHSPLGAPTSSVPPILDTLNPTGDAVTDQDLGVSLCYTDSASTGSCRVLWATAAGQSAAAELATYGPDIDVVVIIANTQLPAGATAQAPLSASQPLVVIGVPADPAEAGNLLAHELAHTLGLTDEYTGSSGSPASGASAYPNVWQPSDPCYAPTTTATATSAGGTELTIPWSRLLTCDIGLDATLDCDSDSDPTNFGCPRVWWPYHTTASCAMFPSLNVKCEDTIGLYEGAYYSASGIYRGANNCRMRDLSAGFCKVCTGLIDTFFDCNYVHPGSCP
jgi:hypothetical protein